MADILELSVQYRVIGTACRKKLLELESALNSGDFVENEYELKRRITMLTAMTRDCIATSNYLRTYSERRERLEQLRQQKAGI
ncbi:MAG: hypothetical protein GXY01_03945 [Clostridiales bacterium]|jgi:hypothetical protein|nr:hypothetical protein [Clostridiales bacterium]